MSFTQSTVSRFVAAERQFGVTFTPNQGAAYPDLKALTQKIYADRVAKLPWVPASWLAGVQKLGSDYPNDVIRFLPSRMANGQPNPNNPLFLDDEEKIDVWMSINDTIQSGIIKYGAAQAAAGRAELNALYAKAAFWDAAYRVAVFAKEAPAKLVGSIFDGASAFLGTFLPDALKSYAKWIFWLIMLLIVGGIVLWYRDKIASLFRRVKGVKP